MTKEPTKPPDPDNLMGQMWGSAPTSDAIKRVTADTRPAGLTTQRRPLTVSIISWVLIVSSGWTLLFLPFTLNNPTTQQVFQATGAAPLAVILLNLLAGIAYIAAGVAMLKRRRWGRQLYVTATPAIIVIGMLLYHFRLLPLFLLGFVLYVVFLVLLTRRAVSDYFAGAVDAPSATGEVAVRGRAPALGIRKKFASILLLILGGWILTTWLLMLLPLSENLPALAISSLVFAVLSSAFVVPGILLWGRQRWAIVLGTLLVSAGGLCSLMGLGLLVVERIGIPGVAPTVMRPVGQAAILSGICAGVVGSLLILGQRWLDRKATGASPGSARWAHVGLGVLAAGVAVAAMLLIFRVGPQPTPSVTATETEPPGPRVPAPPLEAPPSSRPMVGEPGTDAYGYPLTTADKRGLVSLLRHRRYADLSGYVESFQADFEADFRQEYWPIDALDAFTMADPSLEPLLEEWAKQMPESFAPHAARGMYFFAVGWSRRGTRWAAETSDARFAQMQRYHTRAWDDLQRALALRPKLVAAYRRLIGIAMAATSDPDPKRELLDRALAACPYCFQVRVTHMVSLQPRWGGSHAAMQAFAQESARLADANPKLTVLKGYPDWDRCTTKQEGLDGRLAACSRALEAGEHWEFLEARGEVLLEMKEPARALADLSRAVTLRPQHAPALASRAAALTRLGSLEEARAGLMPALAIDPTDHTALATARSLAHAFLMQGYAAYMANRSAEALASYDTAAGLDPEDAEILFWRGAAHARNNDADRAIADFTAAIGRDPRHFEAHRQLDYVLARRGRFDEVVALWIRFIELNPNEPRAYLERGGAYFHQGKKDLALKDAETACRLGLAEGCQRVAQLRGAR